jgi:hypothetical protein
MAKISFLNKKSNFFTKKFEFPEITFWAPRDFTKLILL